MRRAPHTPIALWAIAFLATFQVAATSTAPPSAETVTGHKATAAACFDTPSIEKVSIAHPFAVEVETKSGRFQVTLDGRCAPLSEPQPMQLAGEGAFCGDGNDVLITPSQICPATVVERVPDPPSCFSINAVRSYMGARDNVIEVTLRGGERRRVELETSCAQLDRFDSVTFVSGSSNGKICGHPRDSVYGTFDDSAAGNALGGGFARQFNANDFRECRITRLLPPAPENDD